MNQSCARQWVCSDRENSSMVNVCSEIPWMQKSRSLLRIQTCQKFSLFRPEQITNTQLYMLCLLWTILPFQFKPSQFACLYFQPILIKRKAICKANSKSDVSHDLTLCILPCKLCSWPSITYTESMTGSSSVSTKWHVKWTTYLLVLLIIWKPALCPVMTFAVDWALNIKNQWPDHPVSTLPIADILLTALTGTQCSLHQN